MEEYPLPKFHFQVEWQGTRIGFTEVSGLEVETEMIEYRDGANPEYSKQRRPGRAPQQGAGGCERRPRQHHAQAWHLRVRQ